MGIFQAKSSFFRVFCGFMAFLLIANNLQAQTTPFLQFPSNHLLNSSMPYSFPVLRGIRVSPTKPFEFDFVIDAGDRHKLDQKETSVLIKYFLTVLTVPQEDIWVNLSPYEKDRIIPDELA